MEIDTNFIEALRVAKGCRRFRRTLNRDGVWTQVEVSNPRLSHVIQYLEARLQVVRGGFYTSYCGLDLTHEQLGYLSQLEPVEVTIRREKAAQ